MVLEENSFGLWLRRKRKALDLTREGLADRVGCSAATIRKLETEERRPSVQIVELMAEIFNIAADERGAFIRFARGKDQSPPNEPAVETPWQQPSKSHISNLPATTTSLVGREKEIAQACAYLQDKDIRLITLIGPPGVGKTRLSLEVGRAALTEFEDGVYFVELTQVNDSDQVIPTILQVLRFMPAKNQQINEQLIDGIENKHMLLVLDNCEQLVEFIAALSIDLLSACPRLCILATSREALRVRGEWIFPVPALGTPKEGSTVEIETLGRYPALSLFEIRAQAVQSDFQLNKKNIKAVASICRRLDGLPLAIELISVQIRTMSAQTLLERLNDQFILSTDGTRATSSRQKTMNNAIGWSYDFLTPEEQKLFAYLSVFSGGFTLTTAEAVFSHAFTGKPVSALVTSLLNKSLLQHATDTSGEIRFSMLVTIQQFALNCLRHMGNETEARDMHLAYFLDFADIGEREIRKANQAAWGRRLEDEYDNFHVALEWCLSKHKTEQALHLLGALGWPWEVGGHYDEACRWLEKIRSMPEVGNHPFLLSKMLNHIGRQCWTQENASEARSLLEESQAILLQLGTDGEKNLADSMNWLGLVKLYADQEPETAEAMFTQSFELYQKWEDARGMTLSDFHRGILASELNQDEKARFLLERSLLKFQQLEDLFFIARTCTFLGGFYLKQRRYEQARPFFERQLNIDQEIQFWDGIAEGWLNLGHLYNRQGNCDQASQCFENSVTICGEHGLTKFNAYYFSGIQAFESGHYELAYRRFSHQLRVAQKQKAKADFSFLLIGLAAVAGATNRLKQAAKLSGAAQAMLNIYKDQFARGRQEIFDHQLQMVQKQLGKEAYTLLQKEGGGMNIEQAIEYALGGWEEDFEVNRTQLTSSNVS